MMEQPVARASDIPPGSAKPFPVDGVDVLICNVGGTFYAIEDVCTHDGAPLDQGHLDGACVTCPRHGATFDVRTGAATMPAVVPVATYTVRESGGELYLDR
ncbi:MAG TPA: non-heme iron oxygenase ferredoxin subunit [Candidatus Aquilonibacter sp.]